MNRPRRRVSPGCFFVVLTAVLFGTILLILVARQPWNLPTPQAANPAFAALDDDTRQIAFMSNRDGDWDLYQMTLATRETINLTNSGADEAFPSYDSAGQAITFLSSADRAAEGELTAYIMAADGGGQRRVQNDLATILDIVANGRLNWDLLQTFASGTVFVSLRDLNLEVYRSETDAEGARAERNLSQNNAIDWLPALDVGGGRLVFSSDRAGNQDIYLIDEDGTLRRLTDDPADDLHAVWLSDARQIMFYSERGPLFDGGRLVLYTLDTQDPAAQPALLEGAPLPVEGSAVLVADVQIAPGGGPSIHLGHDGHDWELYYTPAGGGAAVNLTDNEADDLFAAWRPE